MFLYQVFAYAMHGKWRIHNEFKMSAPTWNDKFKLADGLYSVSDDQDQFIKKHETVTDNLPIRIYKSKT